MSDELKGSDLLKTKAASVECGSEIDVLKPGGIPSDQHREGSQSKTDLKNGKKLRIKGSIGDYPQSRDSHANSSNQMGQKPSGFNTQSNPKQSKKDHSNIQ